MMRKRSRQSKQWYTPVGIWRWGWTSTGPIRIGAAHSRTVIIESKGCLYRLVLDAAPCYQSRYR